MEKHGTLAYFEAVRPEASIPAEPEPAHVTAEQAAAARWNEALSTTQGDNIVLYLATLRLPEFNFGLPMANLGLEAASAMLSLGAKAPPVTMVSLSRVRKAIDGLPSEIRRQTAIGFLTGVHQAAIIPVDLMLKRALGDECDIDFIEGTDAERDVFVPLRQRIEEVSGGLVPPAVIKGFAAAISYRILLIASRKFHVAAKLDELLAIYRAGNLPAGFGRDGTLVVLTA